MRLRKYNEHEADLANRPIEEGPLKRLLEGINILQNAAREYRGGQSRRPRPPNLRVALVTARSGKAQKRAVNTLEDWGLTVDDAFFLGGLNKRPSSTACSPTSSSTTRWAISTGTRSPYPRCTSRSARTTGNRSTTGG